MKILVIGANGFLGLKILKYGSKIAPEDTFIGADIDISLIPKQFESYRLDITSEQEIEDVFTYISGNGDVTVNINSDNLRILNIFSGGVEVEPPFTVRSTNTSEYPIDIRFKGIRANTTGYIYYDLETGGEHNSFRTTIKVGPTRPIDKEDELDVTLIIELVIISCVVIVILYMIFAQMRYRKK